MTKSEKNGRIIEYLRGSGPGGQHRNKTESACRITDIATGLSAFADTRSREASYRMALADLEAKIKAAAAESVARDRKARRDAAIKDNQTVRTYHFPRGTVTDHRSGKTASIQDVLKKGRLDKLR